MKIRGTGATPSSSVRRKGAGGAKIGGSFSVGLTSSGAQAGGAGAGRRVDAVSSLLSIQELADLDEEGRRGRAHGEAILDRLEQLRLGLLAGLIPRPAINELLTMVRERRAVVSDPRLLSILEEIELRAAVELAKLRQPR